MIPVTVTDASKAPKVEHWAIFKFSRVTTTLYTENDCTNDYASYEAYLDRAAWVAEIEHLRAKGREFYAAVVKPAKVTTTVKVDIE